MFKHYSKKSYIPYFSLISIIFFCGMFFMPVFVHAAYRDLIEADSPLYYWPMDESSGATSLSAAVGGTAINLTSATTGASGQVDGTAVEFNGTSSFGATASTLNLTAHNKIVVEALFYTDAYDDTPRATWEFSSNVNNQTTAFLYVQNQGSGTNSANVLLKGNTGHTYAYYSRPSAANWHHIVAVYDKGATSNEVNLYVDGVLKTASSRPSNTNNTNSFGDFIFYLMSRAGTTYFSQGKLQHLAIYSNLSESRILAHYEEAFPPALSAGTLSETTHTSDSATVSWTNASGGTSPITAQLERSPSDAGTWSNVTGATTSPVTDTGLSGSTSYDYRVAYTDATATTVYSNTVIIITSGASTTYTLQEADLWDNGYNNVSAPRQSNLSRFIFTTNAASVTIAGTTSIYTNYPQFAHLGLRINGVNQSSLVFTTNGSQSFVLNLGTAGTTRTVEIISGIQSKPSATVIGSFIDSVTYLNNTSFSVVTPTVQANRILVYGDSIASGGSATNPEIEAYIALLRNTYSHSVMGETWGYRALYDDANTSGLRSAFVSRVAGYDPETVWLAIGTNDYGLNKWSATNFGTAYAATLDDLHTALPSARIVCQTPIVRTSEVANGFGNTLNDYRNQISTVCNARSWTTLIDGSTLLTTSDLVDGVHPTTSGHSTYALKINDILTDTPTLTTSSASSILTTSATLNGSISSIGSTTPTVRGFAYGLTNAYEIATTSASGSFSTGNFNTSISGLTANTTYHFRSYATNFAGTAYGADETFTTDPMPTYTVGGTISGLSDTVVLQNNGGDNYSTSANGSFVFATALDDSTNYTVTVLTQPAGQSCTVGNGSGTVSANVTNVSVTCVNTTKAITVFDFNGLSPAVVGSINETDKTIAITVPYGTVLTALVPTITHTGASVSPASDVARDFSTSPTTYTVTAANASTQNYAVTVTVDPVDTYTVGGTISGLSDTVVLQNNGGDNYSTSANGSFVFATALDDSTNYTVTVLTQPAGQSCTVGNGSGTVSANVTNVSVTCVNTIHTITASAGNNGSITPSGTVSVNNGSNQVFSITANPGYNISDVLIDGSSVGAVSSYSFSNVTSAHAISVTFAGTSTGGVVLPTNWVLPIMPPSGGFKVIVNNGNTTTSSRNVSLVFNAGTDIKKIAISMTGDFTDAVQEEYVAFKQWDICSKFGGTIKNSTCPDGLYTVYVRFYNAYGLNSGNNLVSDTIFLKQNTISTKNLQSNQVNPLKSFTKQLKQNQNNSEVKALQVFLNSDPDTKIAPSGVGSPGKETNFFGLLTKKAVIKFQEKYADDILTPWGLKKGTGVVGKTTILKINELISQ
jgi:lysophospholipase L1-like esterase